MSENNTDFERTVYVAGAKALETVPAPPARGMPEIPSSGRQRYYRRALACVGIAALLLGLAAAAPVLAVGGVLGVVCPPAAGVVGVACVLFSVLSMHYMIEFVRVGETGRQRND